MFRRLINRWIARNAFNSLIWFLDTNAPLPANDHNICVDALDVLRKYLYTDKSD